MNMFKDLEGDMNKSLNEVSESTVEGNNKNNLRHESRSGTTEVNLNRNRNEKLRMANKNLRGKFHQQITRYGRENLRSSEQGRRN